MGRRINIYIRSEAEREVVRIALAVYRARIGGLTRDEVISVAEAVAAKDIAEPEAPVLDSVAEESVAEPFEEPVVEKGNPFAGLEMTADGFYILPEGKEIEDYLG